jgi:predicted amidohydrolase
MIHYPAYKVAAAHVAPVFLDTDRSVDKACSVIEEAVRNDARLIAFPEAFLPGFPVWAALAAPIRTHELFKKLAASAVAIDGPELDRIRQTAQRKGIFVSIGFTEGTKTSVGCLWNANALISADGALLNHHRKLVPTYYEKLIWANGDGRGLRVCGTELGRIGVLICGENTNPLARFALIALMARASRFMSRATRRSGRPARQGPATTTWRRPSVSGPARMPSKPRSSTWSPRLAWTKR